MNVTLNFNQKVTTGVYRAVLDHKKYSHVDTCGVNPLVCFDSCHRSHNATDVSGNFLLYDKNGDYDCTTLNGVFKLLDKFK